MGLLKYWFVVVVSFHVALFVIEALPPACSFSLSRAS